MIEQYISALKTYIAANGALPIGALLPYVGTTVPKGYLICNGASLLRSDYPDLFNVIGTRFGAVDSAHFKIPSLHHQFIEATTTLSEVGTYVSAGLPNIPGVIRGIQGVVDPAADGSFSIAPGAIENNIAGSNDQYIETAFSVIFSASNGNSTYGASDTVQPSSLRALVLIRSY
ncbi:phage tail protein [uncultured Parasutterella sp.]|uniref:phage tail protein n=1 Tax=uncultured Parasutterella sp. TaxID=1263098 RepID=UPI00272C0B0C|nr:phage tail protein [uncultured Parasutterella sp.]